MTDLPNCPLCDSNAYMNKHHDTVIHSSGDACPLGRIDCTKQEWIKLCGKKDENKTIIPIRPEEKLYGLSRMKVFGGWVLKEIDCGNIYCVFIPDPTHEWKVE